MLCPCLHVLNMFPLLDETTGSTDDYVKGDEDVQVDYTICAELRGPGFIVDKSEIGPSFDEIWAGLVVMAEEVQVD